MAFIIGVSPLIVVAFTSLRDKISVRIIDTSPLAAALCNGVLPNYVTYICILLLTLSLTFVPLFSNIIDDNSSTIRFFPF